MAKSRTRKNPITNGQMVEAIVAVDVAAQYIKSWTRTETRKLIKSEPLIIPAKWGWQVGKYSVKHAIDTWQVFNDYDELVSTFTCKQSAVTYSLLVHTGRFKQAQNLLRNDTTLSKLTQDKIHYVYSRNRAIKRKDSFTIDVLDARILDTIILLDLAKIDLEKTLNQAKYLKGIWE
jgi:hypothetical protein